MPSCCIEFHLGVLPDQAPGRWIEASALIEGPNAFEFEARLFARTASDDLSMFQIGSKVDGPFTAATILALLTLCSIPPFTPTLDTLDIFVHGDTWLTDGALGRLMNPSAPVEATLEAIPAECRQTLITQLAAAGKTMAAHQVLLNPGAAERS